MTSFWRIKSKGKVLCIDIFFAVLLIMVKNGKQFIYSTIEEWLKPTNTYCVAIKILFWTQNSKKENYLWINSMKIESKTIINIFFLSLVYFKVTSVCECLCVCVSMYVHVSVCFRQKILETSLTACCFPQTSSHSSENPFHFTFKLYPESDNMSQFHCFYQVILSTYFHNASFIADSHSRRSIHLLPLCSHHLPPPIGWP